MTPKQASNALRAIARAIDYSDHPSMSLVDSELRKILVALNEPFGKPSGSSVDERHQQEESKKTLEKAKKDIGKQVEKLFEKEFENLERNIK